MDQHVRKVRSTRVTDGRAARCFLVTVQGEEMRIAPEYSSSLPRLRIPVQVLDCPVIVRL